MGSLLGLVAAASLAAVEHPNEMVAIAVLVLALSAALITLINKRYFDRFLRSIVYLHSMCHPSLPGMLSDVRLFFHAHTARNVVAKTASGCMLPGWHILPAGKESQHTAAVAPSEGECGPFHSACDASLAKAERVVLFFHGVGGCRGGVGLPTSAPSGRVSCKRALASHFNCHVVAFEYRGFGDATDYGESTTPVPSELTIAEDARAAAAFWRRAAVPDDAI